MMLRLGLGYMPMGSVVSKLDGSSLMLAWAWLWDLAREGES